MIPASSSAVNGDGPEPAGTTAPQEKVLLLVDDSPMDQRLIGDLITRHLGWEVIAVDNGEEGRILFYDSTGGRFAEARLTEAPDPRNLAA